MNSRTLIPLVVLLLLTAPLTTTLAAHHPSHAIKKPLALHHTALSPLDLSTATRGFGGHHKLKVNGFISAGFALTNANKPADYLVPGYGRINHNPRFASASLVGVQLTGSLSPSMSAVVQLLATGEDTNGYRPYRPRVDWAFLRYRSTNNAQWRVGRMRIPAFLYSQNQEVGATYTPVILPPEVYRVLPFNDFNGIDLTLQYPLGDSSWRFSFNPLFGQNTSQFDLYTNDQHFSALEPFHVPYGTTATFDENYLYGASATLANDVVTLRGSWLQTQLTMNLPSFVVEIDGALPLAVPAQARVIDAKTATFYSAGAALHGQHWQAALEYVHRKAPDTIASLSGSYGWLGYHVGKYTPYVGYARLWTTDLAKISGPGSERRQEQESLFAGLNYHLSSALVEKWGISYITPRKSTQGLFTPDLTKKHVALFSAQLNVVF